MRRQPPHKFERRARKAKSAALSACEGWRYNPIVPATFLSMSLQSTDEVKFES